MNKEKIIFYLTGIAGQIESIETLTKISAEDHLIEIPKNIGVAFFDDKLKEENSETHLYVCIIGMINGAKKNLKEIWDEFLK